MVSKQVKVREVGFIMDKKLKLEDLKIGIRVKKEQLSEIYGVRIYFDHYDFDKGGKIIHIGEGGTEDSRRAVKNNGGIISTFYQDPLYLDEEVY